MEPRRWLGAAILLGIGVYLLGVVRSGVRRRRWQRTEAVVLGVERVAAGGPPGQAVGEGSWRVRARLRTDAGRQIEGLSQDLHPARGWAGTTRAAWYDPAVPEHFTLARPPGRGVPGVDTVFVGAVVLVVAGAAAALAFG